MSFIATGKNKPVKLYLEAVTPGAIRMVANVEAENEPPLEIVQVHRALFAPVGAVSILLYLLITVSTVTLKHHGNKVGGESM